MMRLGRRLWLQLQWLTLLLATTAGSGAQGQVIAIGQTLSLTGPNGALAKELLQGRQACVDWINAQGGLRGHPLRLVTRDDQGSPTLALQQAQALYDGEHVQLMFGSMGPSIHAVLQAWADTQHLAVLGAHGGDVGTRNQKSGSTFFITANQSAEAARLVQHLELLGQSRIVILYQDDAIGIAAMTVFEEALASTGQLALAEYAVRVDTKNVDAVAAAAVKQEAQAVLLASNGQVTLAALRALRRAGAGAGVPMDVYGMSSSVSPAELRLTAESAKGFVMTEVLPFPADLNYPLIRTFQSAMKQIPGERSYAELEGCLAPLALSEVIDKKPGEINRQNILAALKEAAEIQVGGFPMALRESSSSKAFIDIVYINREGRVSH